MQAITPWVAVYFIIAIVLGAFMLLQLFLAILLGGLDQVRLCTPVEVSPLHTLRSVPVLKMQRVQSLTRLLTSSANAHHPPTLRLQMEADKEKEEQVKGLKRKPSMMMMVGSVVASFKRLGSMKMSGASHSRPPSESSR